MVRGRAEGDRTRHESAAWLAPRLTIRRRFVALVFFSIASGGVPCLAQRWSWRGLAGIPFLGSQHLQENLDGQPLLLRPYQDFQSVFILPP